MQCPKCGSPFLVLITPATPGPNGWQRRCKSCGHRWNVQDEPIPGAFAVGQRVMLKQDISIAPAEAMLDHDRRKRIEHLQAENAALRAERAEADAAIQSLCDQNDTLSRRLAAAEQREQQARAVMQALLVDYDDARYDDLDETADLPSVAQARAWLAAGSPTGGFRAEQRAAAEAVSK